ncbi:MAG: insulinase family protein, partial [Alphaproteobacteria bacterium]|nr:insulinase family protein [Alphaproteobacteria bacterium]
MLPLFAAAAWAADSAGPFALPARVETLDNGLVVLILEQHRTDATALHITFGVGSRDEKAGEFGCAHLFEHLMFEGSKDVPVDMFDHWLTLAGGDNNAYTSNDVTAYHESFPSGALGLALFLESDRLGFLDAGLLPENLENQQKVVLQERAEGYAEPNGRDWDTIARIQYPPGHPYHNPIIGTVADIEGFSLDAVTHFWHEHYRPRNAVLAVVGNIDTEEALTSLRHWYSDVPDAGEPVARDDEPALDPARPRTAALVEDDVEERTLYLVWDAVPDGHPDQPALEMANYILSNGRGTRLDDALYYLKPRTSVVYTYTSFNDVAGEFYLGAASPTTPLPKLAKLARKQIAALASSGPTAAELARAKSSYRSEILDALESPEGTAELLAECWRLRGKADCLTEDVARYDAV